MTFCPYHFPIFSHQKSDPVGFSGSRNPGHSFFLGETASKLRVFVSTSDGRLLQVGYQSRKVLSVHQLHSEADVASGAVGSPMP